MNAIRKSRKKYDGKKAIVIKELAERYQVTEGYVRIALRGDMDNETTREIVKDYNRLYKALENVFK